MFYPDKYVYGWKWKATGKCGGCELPFKVWRLCESPKSGSYCFKKVPKNFVPTVDTGWVDLETS